VLFVDQERSIVHVTLKPSLVQSKKPIISSYDMVPSKQFYEGVVVCVQPKFYLISFYNDVTVRILFAVKERNIKFP